MTEKESDCMSGIKRNPRVRLELSERAYSDRRKLGEARKAVLGCGCKPMCAVAVRCAVGAFQSLQAGNIDCLHVRRHRLHG